MADTLQPEPEMKALSGGIPLDDNVEDLIPEEDGTSSPAAKKKPKDRRRRASVMEMIDEVGAASTKDTSGRVNSIDRAGFDLLCEKMGLRMSAHARKRAFKSLDTKEGDARDGLLDYAFVHSWLRAARGSQLRDTRRLARTLLTCELAAGCTC